MCISYSYLCFFWNFYHNIYQHLLKKIINSTITQIVDESPSYMSIKLKNIFMFAIGITDIGLNTGNRYFDILIAQNIVTNGVKVKHNIPLYPCSRSVWSNLGYQQAYDRLGFSEWLCPDQNLTIGIQGKYISTIFSYYKLTLSLCNNSLIPSRPCVSNTTIQTYLTSNQNFNFNFYFINTLLNPSDQKYVSTYLQDINFFPFTTTQGTSANIFISSYEIQTDQSLVPIKSPKTESGAIVSTPAQSFSYQVTTNGQLLKLYFRKSSTGLSIQRSFQRIDDTLSYIGGLISSILGALLLIGLYNQLSFELQVTKDIYYYKKNTPINSDDFNFLTFLGYLIYIFFDLICIKLPWPLMEKFHQYMEQARKHLDIRLIMKKLIYAQRVSQVLLQKYEAKTLNLYEPMTLQEAQQIRKDYRFYKNFKKKYFPQNQTHNEKQFKLYLNETKQKQFNQQLENKDKQFQEFQIQDDLGRKDTNVNNQGNGGGLNHTMTMIMSMATSQNRIIQKKQQEIKRQEQFLQLHEQMKIYMLQLKEDFQSGDPIAKKIFQQIDPRIKAKYFKNLQFKSNLISKNSFLYNCSYQKEKKLQ